MVQKVNYFICLLVWMFASCGEIYMECEKEETITLKLADSSWVYEAQHGASNNTWVSSKGLTQSASLEKRSYYGYSYNYEVQAPVKLEVDKCRKYVAEPLKFNFTPSIYPVSLGLDILHNPFTKSLQIVITQQDLNSDYNNQFYEEVTFSVLDTALLTNSKLSKYYYSYYDNSTLYYSQATFSPGLTVNSGRTFSNVYKVPLEAFRIISTKANAIRHVWIAKEIGIVQYEMGDGLIWSMK